MRPKGMENLAAFSVRKVKRAAAGGKRKRRVFLCRRIVGVKIGGKVIPASFLKAEGRGRLLGRKTGERGQIEELVGGENPGAEAPPMGKKERERREQRKCRGRSNCRRNGVEG